MSQCVLVLGRSEMTQKNVIWKGNFHLCFFVNESTVHQLPKLSLQCDAEDWLMLGWRKTYCPGEHRISVRLATVVSLQWTLLTANTQNRGHCITANIHTSLTLVHFAKHPCASEKRGFNTDEYALHYGSAKRLSKSNISAKRGRRA